MHQPAALQPRRHSNPRSSLLRSRNRLRHNNRRSHSPLVRRRDETFIFSGTASVSDFALIVQVTSARRQLLELHLWTSAARSFFGHSCGSESMVYLLLSVASCMYSDYLWHGACPHMLQSGRRCRSQQYPVLAFQAEFGLAKLHVPFDSTLERHRGDIRYLSVR